MESIFATILLDIAAHIHSELGGTVSVSAGGAPGRPNSGLPHVTLEFGEFRFESLAGSTQIGVGVLVVRLSFAAYSQPSAATPETYRTKALAYWEVEHKLHRLLQSMHPHAAAGGLDRMSVCGRFLPNGEVEREMRYSLSVTDTTDAGGKTRVKTRPEIKALPKNH